MTYDKYKSSEITVSLQQHLDCSVSLVCHHQQKYGDRRKRPAINKDGWMVSISSTVQNWRQNMVVVSWASWIFLSQLQRQIRASEKKHGSQIFYKKTPSLFQHLSDWCRRSIKNSSWRSRYIMSHKELHTGAEFPIFLPASPIHCFFFYRCQ